MNGRVYIKFVQSQDLHIYPYPRGERVGIRKQRMGKVSARSEPSLLIRVYHWLWLVVVIIVDSSVGEGTIISQIGRHRCE